MLKPVKHLAKSLYEGTWDDEPCMVFIIFTLLFSVVILIMGISCVTGNVEPRELGDLAKVLPPDHVAWKFITVSSSISLISVILSIMTSERYPLEVYDFIE